MAGFAPGRRPLAATACLAVLFLLPPGLTSCNRGEGPGGPPPSPGPGGLARGMTREQVVQVMLREVQALQMSGHVANPYAVRFVRDREDMLLEVLYYYAGKGRGDDLLTEDEMVPVVLENGRVAGWGWDYLESRTGGRPGPLR